MANAIDDIGAKVDLQRFKAEPDEDYALRVLQTLYRTYQSVSASGWTGDRETNEYQLVTPTHTAYLMRGKGNTKARVWIYFVYDNKGQALAEGEAPYLEKAMQICSLVLS